MSGELVSEKKHVLLVTRRVISDPRKWMRKAAKGVPETNEEWLNGMEWNGVEWSVLGFLFHRSYLD